MSQKNKKEVKNMTTVSETILQLKDVIAGSLVGLLGWGISVEVRLRKLLNSQKVEEIKEQNERMEKKIEELKKEVENE